MTFHTQEFNTMTAYTSTEMRAVTSPAQTTGALLPRLMQLDATIGRLLARYSLIALRVSMGLVFVWFGALKFVPGLSPAEPLIRATITFLPMDLFLPLLAALEVLIGLLFLSGRFTRLTTILLLGQMAGAMSPMLLAPDHMWNIFPYAWTLEGQYVFKDIILISVGLVVAATARGGGMTSEAEGLRIAREIEDEA
jgi:uncharacterized membrane protein YphA (DoxX/SURF4 family)